MEDGLIGEVTLSTKNRLKTNAHLYRIKLDCVYTVYTPGK